jgi:DNA-binding protein YbaB
MQPDVVDPDDIEMLSDLIIAATNEAMKKADDAMEQAMSAAKGGLGGLGLPF